MSSTRDWVFAARPKTLGAAIIPVIVGSAIAWSTSNGPAVRVPTLFNPWLSILAGICAVCIQVGTNFFNDVLDFRKGADTHERLGPVRITSAGIATPRAVSFVAILFFVVALFIGGVLVSHGGFPILAIGVCSLIAGYAYTGGPYPLAYKGLGDLFVLIFFGIVAVCGTVYLQLRIWPNDAIVAGIQVGALAVVLIAINNLRDIAGDTVAMKRTIAVRLGAVWGARYIVAVLSVPYLLSIYWIANNAIVIGLFPLLSLPFAFKLAQGVINTPPSTAMNFLLVQAGVLQIIFGVLFCIGFVIGSINGSV